MCISVELGLLTSPGPQQLYESTESMHTQHPTYRSKHNRLPLWPFPNAAALHACFPGAWTVVARSTLPSPHRNNKPSLHKRIWSAACSFVSHANFSESSADSNSVLRIFRSCLVSSLPSVDMLIFVHVPGHPAKPRTCMFPWNLSMYMNLCVRIACRAVLRWQQPYPQYIYWHSPRTRH